MKQKAFIPLDDLKEKACLATVKVRPLQEKAVCLFP